MARFSGNGTFKLAGKIRDIHFLGPGLAEGTTGLQTSFDTEVRGCRFSNYDRAIRVLNNKLFVTDSEFIQYNKAIHLESADDSTIIGNHFDDGGATTDTRIAVHGFLDTGTTIIGNRVDGGQACFLSDSFEVTVANNKLVTQSGLVGIEITGINVNVTDNILEPNGDGIVLDGSEGCVVAGNIIRSPGVSGPTNTYDGIRVVTSDNCRVVDNKVIASTHATNKTRYGINVASGSCNIAVGNDLGDPADYASDALVDTATDTQLTYPADPTYGDNFTLCPPTSP